MGLDMYLSKKIYVGANYEHNNITGVIKLKKYGKELPINQKRITYIEEQVGYWRKANQIHKWFVDNVQDGNDDCKDYYVDEKQLEKLLSICKEIKSKCKLKAGSVTNGYTFENGIKMPIVEEGKEMANQEFAHSLLPTTSGFFFGNTDYNQYYMDDIDDTIEIIETLLQEKEEGKDYINGDIYYTSSW